MRKSISLLLIAVFIFSALLLTSCAIPGQGGNDTKPVIGENGNWWFGDTDTGVAAKVTVTDVKTEYKSDNGAAVCVVTLTYSDGSTTTHSVNMPALVGGDNGNWWLGNLDTGIPKKLKITNTDTQFFTSGGVEYCTFTFTMSDGSTKKHTIEMPKRDEPQGFTPTATISNGKGGANGIVCLMTDNDSGKFETLALVDELYVKYGLVGGLGTVARNLYTDSTYKNPKTSEVAKWQEFLDTGRWKIICHSMTHKTYMDTLNGEKVINEERLYNEIVGSAQLLRQLFPDEKVLTYAMVGTQSAIGESSDPNNIRECERQLIAQHYVGGRFSYTGAVAFDKLQWNNLPYTLLSTKNLPTILSNIDKAATEGKYYMVYNHYVIEDELIDTVPASSWTTKSTAEALCERVAQYVNDGSLWCAHFEDAVMYMRERATASISATLDDDGISLTLTDEMDDGIYNYPLTVKLTVPTEYEAVKITQGNRISYAVTQGEGSDYHIYADVIPDRGVAKVEPIKLSEIPESKPESVAPTPDITTFAPVKSNTETPKPDVFTFDELDSLMGTHITFDNASVSSNTLATVSEGTDKVLKISKSEAGSNPSIYFIEAKNESASTLTCEADVMIERTSAEGEVYFTLRGQNDATVYTFYLNPSSNGTITLTDYNNGKGDQKKTNSITLTPKAGAWFKLKIVYTEGSRDSLSFKIYVDGSLVLTSDNYYSVSGEVADASTVTTLRINLSQKYIGNLYLDDVSIKQSAR